MSYPTTTTSTATSDTTKYISSMTGYNPNLFTGSCKPQALPCQSSTFVDPCNCTSYYLCYDDNAMPMLRHCPSGFAWDDYVNNCEIEKNVYQFGMCTESTPWSRCQRYGVFFPEEFLKLKYSCLSKTPTSTPSVPAPEPTSKPVDTTVVVTGVIAGLALVALVILLVLLLYKWRSKIKLPSMVSIKRRTKENDYSEPEIYDTIDVNSMRKSISSEKPVVPVRPVHTFPYSERPNSGLRPPSLSSNISVTPKQDTSPSSITDELYTVLDDNLQSLDHVPTEYSQPYEPLEVTQSKNTKDVSQDSSALTSQPDYVDFGHYDNDYTLATDPK